MKPYEKHPEKRREYYEKGRERYKARRKFTQKERSRVQRRARAVDNYDYLQSMDKYELAEFLARISGKSDKAYLEYLERELKEGNLNE